MMGILKNLKKIVLEKHIVKDPAEIDKNELWLKKLPIKTFIDIGAYVGEYVKYSEKLYPKAKIYAFEPLKEGYGQLLKLKKMNENLTIFNIALSDKDARQAFYKSSYFPSSSLLKMDVLHKKSFPFAARLRKETVEVRKLDAVFADILLEKEIFIKIDTQGNEGKIIDGGINTIRKSKIIQLEVSFYPLYKGQLLFHDIYQKLRKLGFLFHGIRNQITSPLDGSILQAHVYFINEKK